MSKHPVKRAGRALRKVESDAVEVIPRVRKDNPSSSFRYSYTEISILGGKGHVKFRQTSLLNGKLTSEALEGDVDRTVYEQMLRHAQQFFLGQTTLAMKSLAWLLPFYRKQRTDRD